MFVIVKVTEAKDTELPLEASALRGRAEIVGRAQGSNYRKRATVFEEFSQRLRMALGLHITLGGGWSGSTPRFPMNPWGSEIVKIRDFSSNSIDFHGKALQA